MADTDNTFIETAETETEDPASFFEEISNLGRIIEQEGCDLQEQIERIGVAISSLELLKEDYPHARSELQDLIEVFQIFYGQSRQKQVGLNLGIYKTKVDVASNGPGRPKYIINEETLLNFEILDSHGMRSAN